MSSILVCRNCGARSAALDLAVNQQELANVGMLERRCTRCARETPWGLAEDYRRKDRRASERRSTQRRAKTQAPPAQSDRRRGQDRRLGDLRRTQRRGSR